MGIIYAQIAQNICPESGVNSLVNKVALPGVCCRGRRCLHRGIKVGSGVEENLLPAGEVDIEEVELLLATDEDLVEVVGVEARLGCVARH